MPTGCTLPLPLLSFTAVADDEPATMATMATPPTMSSMPPSIDERLVEEEEAPKFDKPTLSFWGQWFVAKFL
eukprot:m.532877 g.532877  ORF g.532877 m.532877 type:complete len:72 (-) comp216244_c0_seq1:76-291(-)